MNNSCIIVVRYNWGEREAVYRGELVAVQARVRDIKAGNPNPDIWLRIKDMQLLQAPREAQAQTEATT